MPTTNHTPYQLPIPCCTPGWTHFRATDAGTLVCTRSGGYAGCGRTITLDDAPAPARDNDTVTVHDGVLVYAIDPAAQFTHLSGAGWPRTFTARELDEYLARICVWQHFTRDSAILAAARNGRHVETSGTGLQATITRIA
ncbi:hypothetical protein [Streptomyces pseudogriseolus]|uniref:hypothetical protein n=1 Tax=Streptomyces pseudogriseolus TaxID=36817 RepID=UPI003FA33939